MLRVRLFLLAEGACATAFSRPTASITLPAGALRSMLDDVTQGVRHRCHTRRPSKSPIRPPSTRSPPNAASTTSRPAP